MKITAPIKKSDDIKILENTQCKSVYVYHSYFVKNGFELINDFIEKAQNCGFELFVNFKSNICENEIELVADFIKFLENTQISGIMVNSYSVLELIKDTNLPFKVNIDSGLDIHNLSGIEFVSLFHNVENINITEEVYIKNISKIKKFTKLSLSIDSNNLPWIAQEIKKSKTIDSVIIKGDFKTPDELLKGVELIEKIIEKPSNFQNKKLPFKGPKNYFYESNHFSGEFLSTEGKDFKFRGNVQKFDWNYKRANLKKPFKFNQSEIPRINLRLTSFEQLTVLNRYIKALKFNPIYSIEYGEILSTADLAKSSFNKILEKTKKFCHSNNINLQISTPKILIERDFDRVYEYVKEVFAKEPIPASMVVNNIGLWWSLVNDTDYENTPIELGQGLNLSTSTSILALANRYRVSSIDLSNIKDINEIKIIAEKIKPKIPNLKLTVGGCVRVPSSGLCPLNNDSAILSRLSCTAPCHRGNYAIFDPSTKNRLPVAVDGFCRMHLYKEHVLDLFKYIRILQGLGINEFIIDFSSLSAKLIPVLLNRFLNSLSDENYTTDKEFIEDEYKIKDLL